MKIDFSWLNPFKKKKETVSFPNKFALIRFSDQAKERGTFDDENKIIEIYKKGEVIDKYPYSSEIVKSLEEVYEIPVEEEVFKEELFDFQEVANFGQTEFRR